MNDPIRHLPGIEAVQVRSARLTTHVLTAGPQEGVPVLFLHGNLSAATFWEETMLALPEKFRAVAPDQRGFGLSDRSAQMATASIRTRTCARSGTGTGLSCSDISPGSPSTHAFMVSGTG